MWLNTPHEIGYGPQSSGKIPNAISIRPAEDLHSRAPSEATPHVRRERLRMLVALLSASLTSTFASGSDFRSYCTHWRAARRSPARRLTRSRDANAVTGAEEELGTHITVSIQRHAALDSREPSVLTTYDRADAFLACSHPLFST